MLEYSNGRRGAISGASLAQLRRNMSADERAILAADIIDGRVILQGLTAKSIGGLCGVNVGYVDQALRLTPEQREQVKRGDRPLLRPRPRPSKRAAPIDWEAIGDDMLVDAIRQIGIDRALDAAIAAEHVS